MIQEDAFKYISGAEVIVSEEKNGRYLLHDAEIDNFIWDSDGGLTIRLWLESEIITLHFPEHVIVNMESTEFQTGWVTPNSVVSNMEVYLEDGSLPLVVELQTVGITVRSKRMEIKKSKDF